uniref:DUF834 domain-containing protein n=1 Tax=Oryza glaberrima TaxID=4538 RepID=I1PW89_ORYGL
MLKRSNGVGVTVDWGGDGEVAMLDLAPLPDPAPSRLDLASPMREDGRDDEPLASGAVGNNCIVVLRAGAMSTSLRGGSVDVEAVGCNCEAVARASRRGDASSTVGTTAQGGAASGGRGLLGASSSSRQRRLVRHKVSWPTAEFGMVWMLAGGGVGAAVPTH